MKQLLKTWTQTQFEIDPDTGKPGAKVMTEIFSVYKVSKDREVAEVETIYEQEPLYVVEGTSKLFIETPEMDGITKKAYRELVAVAIGKDNDKVDQAVYKAAYKIQRMLKTESLYYHKDYVNVAVEIYKTL